MRARFLSGKPSGSSVRGYDKATAYTSAIEPSYVLHEASRDITPGPLYVHGSLGSCIRQLAARLNYPVFEVTGHGRLEFADLVPAHRSKWRYDLRLRPACACHALWRAPAAQRNRPDIAWSRRRT